MFNKQEYLQQKQPRLVCMRKRQSTITQQYSPTIRRRLKPNYLSLSLPGGFALTEVEPSSPYPNSRTNQQQSHHSATTPSKNKHEQRLAQNYDNFVQNHSKIHEIIDKVDQIIRKRMEVHEEGLLTVVRSQIDKMQADCKKVVTQYNRMIQSKNKETEIYNLKNQLEYFRKAALDYFEENKRLVDENCELREMVKVKDSIIDQLNGAIKRIQKKYLKQKAVVERKDKQLSQISNETLLKKIQKLTKESSSKIIPETLPNNPSNTDINVNSSKLLNMKQSEQQKPQINISSVLQHDEVKKISIKNSLKTQQKDIQSTQKKIIITHRYSENKNYFASITSNKLRKTRMRTQVGTSFSGYAHGEPNCTTVKAKHAGKSKSFWKFQGSAVLS